MNFYHWAFVIIVLVLIIGIVKCKKVLRAALAVFLLLIFTFSFADYSLMCYRGLGFMRSDFCNGASLALMFRNMSFPKEIKSYKGLITDYPNNICCFRGEKLFPKLSFSSEQEWWERDSVICHALGTTAEGDTLTNSYNALEYNYARGFRTFETDISFTLEGIPVLRHDWASDLGQAEAFGWTEEEKSVPTSELFLNSPIYGKNTPMTLADLFEFMDCHKDVYVVFDMKMLPEMTEAEQYQKVVDVAMESGCVGVLDRCVVQLYYMGMHEEIEKVYHFDNYLLTLYMIGDQPHDEMGRFLEGNDIPVLTVPGYFDVAEISSDMKPYGISVYTHTIDDYNDASSYFKRGAKGIYTDTITPFEAEKIKAEGSNE